MSAIQTAAANTVLRIANLFEQNCALKHGLPKVGGPDRVDETPNSATHAENVSVTTTETTTQESVTDSPSPGEGAAVGAPSSLWRRAAPLLLTAAVGAGVPSLWLLNSQNRNTPPAPIPSEQPIEQARDGDLLQWLQSQGKHLPEGAWPTK